jgi:hypothetical protein
MLNWLCEITGLNCIDLDHAINDITLQGNVTGILLIILLIISIAFGWISHRLIHNKKEQNKLPVRPPMRRGLRARIRHPQPKIIQQSSPWWSDFLQNISTEFFGAVVTTLLLGLGVLIFDQYQEIQNQKDNLILQMNSPDRVLAIEAVRILASEGWLFDGTLNNKNFADVNLEGTRFLAQANLKGANLNNANLRASNLRGANLEDTSLVEANLEGSRLIEVNLRRANLTASNLTRVDLTDADLSGADLTVANLQDVILDNVIWDNSSILPDGTTWTPDRDLSKFTNSEN